MGFIKCDDRNMAFYIYNVLAHWLPRSLALHSQLHGIYINRSLGLFDLMYDM